MVQNAAEELGVQPGVILYGRCSDYDFDKVNWRSQMELGFVTSWIGVQNKVRANRFLRQHLDGLDWQTELVKAVSEDQNSG